MVAVQVLAVLLMFVGCSALLMRRNLLVHAIAGLLMFLAAGLMAATREPADAAGHRDGLIIACAATAELVLLLALVVALFRRRRRIDVDSLEELGS